MADETPALHEAVLSAEEVRQLFADLTEHAELIEIGLKGETRTHQEPAEGLGLAEALAVVEQRAARGVQIRYRYQGAQWWDTLMIQPEGVRLVRIRHDF
ncbi:MAG: hypothetical protein ACYS0D_16515 [Planctomycetota bacterium]|jgi:hypothetical protein